MQAKDHLGEGDRPLDPASASVRAPWYHGVEFYGDRQFLIDASSRYIGEALDAGNSAIVFANDDFGEALDDRLHHQGLDVGLARNQGRYETIDARTALSWLMVDGKPSAERFEQIAGGAIGRAKQAARTDGHRVAVFGEMVALLWEDGQPDAAIQLERLWNDLATRHAFALKCAYPLRAFPNVGDDASMERICAQHTHVAPTEAYMTLATDDERLRTIALLEQKALALEREIATRRRTEEALRHANDELRRAIATRDAFLSIAAHELKTPLTGLRSFAQLLLRDVRAGHETLPRRFEIALHAIELQTSKLDHLVGRLLDTDQIESNRLRIELRETDLAELVRSAIEQQTDETHTFTYQGPDHCAAHVDPVRFAQVVNNLLENAVKYSPQGGAITVGLTRNQAGEIQLSITDHGIGIPLDQHARVFERFYQAHGRRHLSGLGLGLYITREIVELHGGRVRIEEPDQPGTRVVVMLPTVISQGSPL